MYSDIKVFIKVLTLTNRTKKNQNLMNDNTRHAVQFFCQYTM